MTVCVRINLRQFATLVAIFTIGSSILVSPSGLAHEAKQDAWIAAIGGTGVSMLFIWLYSRLGSRFPQLTIAQYSELILGRWLGKFVSLSFFTYFFILAALLLREISDFVTTEIMPETPIQFIQMLYLAIVVMAAWLGLEVITRASEVFFPWIILLFLFLVICLSPELDFQKMQPLLGDGIQPLLYTSFQFLGLPYLELVVFLMILPYVNRPEKAGKAFAIGTMVGGTVLILTSTLSILVLGADTTARNVYPSFTLAKKVSIGDFLERLEVLMAGIWFLSLYFKLTVCFFTSALVLAQTFKLKEYRPLLLPLGMILIPFSILSAPNITYFNQFLADIWTPYSLTYGLFLPLLLLVVDTIRSTIGSGTGR